MALNLSEDQAARVRQVYMLSGIRQGLSGNAIIDSLRSLGLGQRTSTMQSQIASLVGRPGPLPSLDSSTLQALQASSPYDNFVSRSSEAFLYTVQLNEGSSIESSYVPEFFSVSSDYLLPDQLVSNQLFSALETATGVDQSTLQEAYTIQKPKKYTPFNP